MDLSAPPGLRALQDPLALLALPVQTELLVLKAQPDLRDLKALLDQPERWALRVLTALPDLKGQWDLLAPWERLDL